MSLHLVHCALVDHNLKPRGISLFSDAVRSRHCLLMEKNLDIEGIGLRLGLGLGLGLGSYRMG